MMAFVETERETYDGKYEPVYTTSCGHEYPSEYWTPETLDREHGRCRTCAIIEGRSKATVLTQDEVVTLFRVGIDGRRSGTGNYRSSDGILTHYGTIEGVRTKDGTVISNVQCWNAGFAHCSLHGADARLPLTTIREVLGWNAPGGTARGWASTNIEVLDATDDTTLFRLAFRYFLFGERDGDRWVRWLCELPGEADTVADGLLSLMPSQVFDALMDERPVLRHGDLFLIPTDAPRDDELTDVPQRAHFKLSATTGFERKLVRPKILGTNHSAGEVAPTTRGFLVRGTIRHERFPPEHAPLRLGKVWHVAVKNAAVASWQVLRRGGRMGVD